MDEFRKIVAELRQYQAEQGIRAPAAPAPAPAPADEIEMVFQKFDADRSGTIDPKELTKMLREMGIDADASAATTVISAFDSDKSGGLGVAEFRKLVTEIRAATSGKRDEKAPMPAWLKAISKPVPKNAYLPRFKSRKKLDEEKAGNFEAYMDTMKKEQAKQEAIAPSGARHTKEARQHAGGGGGGADGGRAGGDMGARLHDPDLGAGRPLRGVRHGRIDWDGLDALHQRDEVAAANRQ